MLSICCVFRPLTKFEVGFNKYLSLLPAVSRAQPYVVLSYKSGKLGPQFMRPYFCGRLTSGMLQFAP
jgi:hypothetical protein